MRTKTRVARIRGLQDILSERRDGQGNQLDILNKLVLMEREKERILQERGNWQKKIELIDARLAEIGETMGLLKPLVLVEEGHQGHPSNQRSSKSDWVPSPDEDVALDTVTIQY